MKFKLCSIALAVLATAVIGQICSAQGFIKVTQKRWEAGAKKLLESCRVLAIERVFMTPTITEFQVKHSRFGFKTLQAPRFALASMVKKAVVGPKQTIWYSQKGSTVFDAEFDGSFSQGYQKRSYRLRPGSTNHFKIIGNQIDLYRSR